VLHDIEFFSVTDRVNGTFRRHYEREPVHMTAITAEALLTYNTSGEDYVLSFDCDLVIDDAEFSRIKRRMGLDADETVTDVSACNSWI
jgi:hypothetical protein